MSQRPPRTFGLMLAIIVSVLLFTALPLLQVLLVLAIRARLSATNLPGEEGAAPFAVGGSFEGLDDSGLIVQVILGAIFLGIAVAAWIGRPRGIRWVMMAAVLLLTGLTAGIGLIAIFTPDSIAAGLDSGRGLSQGLQVSRLLFSTLLALYVLWYMNRAPARAFYRGAYLPDPDAQSASSG